MTIEEVRTRLLAASDQAGWSRLLMQWRENRTEDLFHALFELALSDCVAPEARRAADMLVEVEPPCPISLDVALRAIARSDLNLSERAIPFYLLTQFGPDTIRAAVRRLATGEFAPDPPPVLTGIAYWLSIPKIELVRQIVEHWKV
jgi:hypothetical protein